MMAYSESEGAAASPATIPFGKRPTFFELRTANCELRTADCGLRAVCGTVFVFRKRRGTAIMVLAYDGQSARRPRVPGRRFDAIGK